MFIVGFDSFCLIQKELNYRQCLNAVWLLAAQPAFKGGKIVLNVLSFILKFKKKCKEHRSQVDHFIMKNCAPVCSSNHKLSGHFFTYSLLVLGIGRAKGIFLVSKPPKAYSGWQQRHITFRKCCT